MPLPACGSDGIPLCSNIHPMVLQRKCGLSNRMGKVIAFVRFSTVGKLSMYPAADASDGMGTSCMVQTVQLLKDGICSIRRARLILW